MLTVKQISAAKPAKKQYKLPRERGLYLLVYPNGVKGWRHSITNKGRETTLSYGNYPDVSLKLARQKRDETRLQLAQGIDPVARKRAEKQARENTFEAVAREWLNAGCPPNKNNKPVEQSTIYQLTRRLENHVFPRHGRVPIRDITVPELHQTLRRIVIQGNVKTAHCVRSVCGRVFRYAIATGRAERDTAADLKDALPSADTKSFAAITEPAEIGELLRAIDSYSGQPSTREALRLAPYVFVRPSELRWAEWAEVDLDASEWTIPAARMKMSRDHWVPLSNQAVAILRDLHRITGRRRLVFPGIRSAERPISENTLNGALRRLDYTSEQMTSHGFRTLASTRLNELGFDPDVIESQLAHVDRNAVRRIYNRAEYADKRRTMMQSWADYLDGLKSDKQKKVVAIRG